MADRPEVFTVRVVTTNTREKIVEEIRRALSHAFSDVEVAD